MTVAVLAELATGRTDVEAIGEAFRAWAARGPSDVGIQTSRILATRGPLAQTAAAHFEANPRNAAGNGSLMRTGPVALAHPGDREAIAALARQVSDLTHGDPTCGDACVLWSVAIDRTIGWVPEGEEEWNAADAVRTGLDLIPEERREMWGMLIDEAEVSQPEAFPKNGWVVHAFQAALAAICCTPAPADDPARHLRLVLERAVRVGLDTDTVAAIAGALVGARWGATALPFEWRRAIHGQGVEDAPVMRLADLERMARLAAGGGEPDAQGWPSCESMLGHYEQAWSAAPLRTTIEGVEFGNVHALTGALDDGAEVVVSLCRMGTADVPAEVEHHVLGLLDSTADENPNLNADRRGPLADQSEAATSSAVDSPERTAPSM